MTYNLRGGSVGVRCEGTSIALLWATPSSGFTVIVNHDGPEAVDVRFEADHHRSRLDADCQTGELAAEPREDD